MASEYGVREESATRIERKTLAVVLLLLLLLLLLPSSSEEALAGLFIVGLFSFVVFGAE